MNLKFCFIKIAHRATYILWIWCIQFFGGEVNEAMKGTSFRGGILVMNSVSFLPLVCWSRLMQSRLSSFKLKLTNIQIGETQLETHHLIYNPVSAINLAKNWQDRSKYRLNPKICLMNPNAHFFGSDWIVPSWSKIGLHLSKIWIKFGGVILPWYY